MSFVGKVSRVSDAYIRPHEVVICKCDPDQEGCIPATIDRVVTLGFDNRRELTLADVERVWAQLTHDEMQRLGLVAVGVVGVDLSQHRLGWEPGGLEAVRPSETMDTVIPIHPDEERERRASR